MGSDEENEGIHILMKDEGVSSMHAQLTNEGHRWKLSDLMSANGTYVNGKKANVSYLSSGDRIRFGPVECVCHVPALRKSDGAGRRRALLIAMLACAAALAAALVYRLLA